MLVNSPVVLLMSGVLVGLFPSSEACWGQMSRMFDRRRSHHHPLAERRIQTEPEVIRINSPGQRFTATHGIAARRGERKLLVFKIDRTDVNYMAVSSNIAIEGTRGGPESYDLYMKYGQPPTPTDYDQRSTVTASESYIGDVLYSRDITLPRPTPGNYYILLIANKDFHELLITAIMDTPPDEGKASFAIRRMGKF